jgi:hypothetical protein
MRFAIGPGFRSPIVWALVGASALPLLLGRGIRFVWAARLWAVACASWVLAFATTHGWTGSFTPSESVVLVPAAVAVAAGVGLGISSFESDLVGTTFGWRQIASGLAVIAVTVGLLPVVAGALNGRWDLPASGVEQPLSFLSRPSTTGVYRTLWLGDPRALPVGGWSVEPGLSFALTAQDLPDAADVWAPAGPGPAESVARAVRLAIEGRTIHLGQLLAAESVHYVVVMSGLSSSGTGIAPSVAAAPPSGLLQALLDQNDLQIVQGVLGVEVLRDDATVPVTAQRARSLVPAAVGGWPTLADVVGWQPVLGELAGHPEASGAISAGTVFAGYAPAGSFTLRLDGRSTARRPAFVWAAQYRAPAAGRATLTLHRFPYGPLGVLLEVLLWAVLAAALLGWPRLLRRQRRPPLEPGT